MMDRGLFWTMAILKNLPGIIAAFSVFFVVRAIEQSQEPSGFRTALIAVRYFIAIGTIAYVIPETILDRARYANEHNKAEQPSPTTLRVDDTL